MCSPTQPNFVRPKRPVGYCNNFLAKAPDTCASHRRYTETRRYIQHDPGYGSRRSITDFPEPCTAPPTLIYRDRDAVADKSSPTRLYSNASRHDLSATLGQQQLEGSVRPIRFVSCTTPGDEGSCPPPSTSRMVASRLGNQNCLRGCLGSTEHHIYSDYNEPHLRCGQC